MKATKQEVQYKVREKQEKGMGREVDEESSNGGFDFETSSPSKCLLDFWLDHLARVSAVKKSNK